MLLENVLRKCSRLALCLGGVEMPELGVETSSLLGFDAPDGDVLLCIVLSLYLKLNSHVEYVIKNKAKLFCFRHSFLFFC